MTSVIKNPCFVFIAKYQELVIVVIINSCYYILVYLNICSLLQKFINSSTFIQHLIEGPLIGMA